MSEQADSSTVKTALLKVFVHFVDAQICGDILVVDDVKDQRIDNGVYWIGCTFLQVLLKEVANGRKRYKQDGLRYTVIVKEEFPQWREARVHLLHFCGEAAETLFIYLQKSVRRADEVNYETVTAWIPFTGTKSMQPITVLYSKSQNKYFLNSQTYEEYRKKYGLPFVVVKYAKLGKTGALNLCGESELRAYGYSVSQRAGLSRNERQALLANLIDNGLVTKARIITYLELMIDLNWGKDRLDSACAAWMEDKEYVLAYHMNDQRSILVAEVIPQDG